MSIQLRLPAVFLGMSRRDPRDRLGALKRDKAEALQAIRATLDQLARRYGIADKDVEYAMDGWADNLVNDAVYTVESALDREIEDQEPV